MGCAAAPSHASSRGSSAGAAAVHIEVRPAAETPLRWMGLGVEFDPYSVPPSPQRWQQIEQRLDFMRPGFFRVMLDATDYCSGFDRAGHPNYAWAAGATPMPGFQQLLRVLTYAQSRGVRVFLGQWSPPGSLGIHTPSDPRWAAMQADLVAYLVHQRHITAITDAIFFNEPNGQWMWRHSAPDFSAWIDGVAHLREALDARGLQQIGIAGPDNSGDTAWFNRAVQQDHALFRVWESHIYATDAQVNGRQIEQQLQAQTATILKDDPEGAQKERFIAEAGLQDGKNQTLDQQPRVFDFPYGVMMADYVVQVADAGWLGVDAWDLDDAMHANGHGGLKIWGFWNSSAPDGMTLRPWFYSWSILSRSLPRGAQLEEASCPEPSLRVAAAHWNKQGVQKETVQEETVVIVNRGVHAQQAAVADGGLRGRLAEYLYAGDSRTVDAQTGFARPLRTMSRMTGTVTVEVPANAVLVLTTDVP
jgi:hypothetical protein